MVTIRIQTQRDGIFTILSSVRKTVRQGGNAFRVKDRTNMSKVVAEHNRLQFAKGQARGGWKRITVGAAIFSRKDDWMGSAVGNMGQIKRHVNSLDPLNDTGRLEKSLTNPAHREFKVKQTKLRMTFSTTVPYAGNHTKGKSRTHRFGSLHKSRLRKRVPPPPEEGRAKKGGKRLRGTSNRSKKQGLRPFYRLRTWARKRYPTTAKTPIRTWLAEASVTIVKRIEEVVIKGVIQRALRPGPRAVVRGSLRRGIGFEQD